LTSEGERGPGIRAALARCISVSEKQFAANYWGRVPLLSRAHELHEDFSDLFSLAVVDELVANRAMRTPFVRMANEGTMLAAHRYTSPSGFGAEVSDQLDPDKVLTEFAAGATLVLQGLHRTWEPLRDFTRRLVHELGHPAQVNAYITPASSRGFDPHYDVHDVIVIQIHGEKHWVIHPPVHENPLADQPWSDHSEAVAAQATGPAAIDATFAPGDVLYLPRGWIHSASALGGVSIHLTIGVSALTRWDIVEQVVASLKDDAGLRSSLPIGSPRGDAAELANLVLDTVSALTVALERGIDPAPVSRRLAAQLASSTRPEPVLPISTVERLAALDSSDAVRWRDGAHALLERDETSVRVILRTKTVVLPIEAARAVEDLANGGMVSAASLVGLDAASSIVVARRLLREGILVFG